MAFVLYKSSCLMVMIVTINTVGLSQAISCAAAYEAEWPLLIISPSSARYHWEHELLKWLDEDSITKKEITVVCKRKQNLNRGVAKVVIISYELVRLMRTAIGQVTLSLSRRENRFENSGLQQLLFKHRQVSLKANSSGFGFAVTFAHAYTVKLVVVFIFACTRRFEGLLFTLPVKSSLQLTRTSTPCCTALRCRSVCPIDSFPNLCCLDLSTLRVSELAQSGDSCET